MFHISDPRDIKAGRVTDVYFARTLEILKARGVDKRVRAELFAKTLPGDYGWGVLAGVEEAAYLMEGRKVNIRSMAEGEVFFPWEPVMEIEGSYQEFCVFETALLGLLCQATGVATKSARIRIAAGERTVVSFGARRMHPVVAPMIERAAFIGGCDGVAVIVSAELLDIDPMGTMPHALILVLGDTVEAIKAFDESVDARVKRVALVDTFNDEKFESIRVAEAMGGRLFAVRLDTPSSRRGDFYRIFEEVRWELDLRGFKEVKLFASGGLDEAEVVRLAPLVDAFGVGTCISNAPVVDFSMDIMEIEGKPLAKKGKWSGAKDVLRCSSCGARKVVPMDNIPKCSCGGEFERLLKPLILDGMKGRELPSPKAIREKVVDGIKGLCL
ncbi:MAG TPA: nicotinate phosphoribosyltransferase [Deltaproteobacteria bacterium]|nr:MAG: nicotinate phosphoribosyltransferase [Deltaproteobacteria bacterium GWA2_55_82]OGQ64500.1 MAG: nicotinate phosphoribosyltransferase [Deltaproteobacteria bacterium RIFCSPLOWO2_02_FULL_55_12]OIJ73625.1 MAG: nicotinate phosphoribosyltransferase [Deltaproteobacteria bacterium GWC2_55_46]HBG47763.1 nicotinate phosphoribosyltransferase [Deltaproteobacteria bacterium]HCY12015.1 nicotinate phosphoribosyltransferase [Deltaproteobacteria bacterium]